MVLKLNVNRRGGKIKLELQGQRKNVFVQLINVTDIRSDREIQKVSVENGIQFEMREDTMEFVLE